MTKKRCLWTNNRPEYIKYHDEEWGVPIRNNDQKMFEVLALEILRYDFSRLIILQLRSSFNKAFKSFNIETVSSFTSHDIEQLFNDESIVSNKAKIKAIIKNAQCILTIQQEYSSFCNYIWSFSEDRVINNLRDSILDIPLTSPEAEAMSKELKKRKLLKINSQLCYGFMQAAGLVNDHTIDCFRYSELLSS